MFVQYTVANRKADPGRREKRWLASLVCSNRNPGRPANVGVSAGPVIPGVRCCREARPIHAFVLRRPRLSAQENELGKRAHRDDDVFFATVDDVVHRGAAVHEGPSGDVRGLPRRAGAFVTGSDSDFLEPHLFVTHVIARVCSVGARWSWDLQFSRLDPASQGLNRERHHAGR